MIVHNFKVLKAPFEMGQHHCFKDFFYRTAESCAASAAESTESVAASAAESIESEVD